VGGYVARMARSCVPAPARAECIVFLVETIWMGGNAKFFYPVIRRMLIVVEKFPCTQYCSSLGQSCANQPPLAPFLITCASTYPLLFAGSERQDRPHV
jgi:hypothetical protein